MQHVVRDDYLNDDVNAELDQFDRSVEDRLSDQNFRLNEPNDFYIQDEPDDVSGVICEVDYGDMHLPETLEADDLDDSTLDKSLNAELIFDVGTIVKRAKGTSGESIGRAHANPLFDTREYVVEFTDGSTENYFAKLIAECMYAQIDTAGNQYQLLSEITDHRSDKSAIQSAETGTGFQRR